MTKKNETKSSAKSEQQAAIEAPATVETPAVTETPTDSKGCEAVTVIVIESEDFAGDIAVRSVKQNLKGVDADIQVVKGDLDVETLKSSLDFVQTERIILMTANMIILNPVLLSDIALVKAKKMGNTITANTGMPVMVHKSALDALLKEAEEANQPHIDILDTYFPGTVPTGFTPFILGDWNKDPFVLPVVSKNPSIEAISKFAEWKKFMHIGPDSWSEDLKAYLENRFKA